MRPIWILGAAVGLAAGPALAQGLIAPSRDYNQYKTPQREKLDKTYGLPTFGTQGESMPKQQATTSVPKQDVRPDPFKPMPSFANPTAPQTDDPPDFFQKPAGLASSETGVPNFFQGAQDVVRPKVAAKPTGETSLFTTDEGMTTGDTTTEKGQPAPASDD
jgi:hypothetical protein